MIHRVFKNLPYFLAGAMIGFLVFVTQAILNRWDPREIFDDTSFVVFLCSFVGLACISLRNFNS